jgi:hypothetical protein
MRDSRCVGVICGWFTVAAVRYTYSIIVNVLNELTIEHVIHYNLS